MSCLVLYFVGFIRVILSSHLAVPWLEICRNEKIMSSSKCWAIVSSLITINSIIRYEYWVDFLSGVREEKRCFTLILLPTRITWNPFTGCVPSEDIPVFRFANRQCWSLITTFPPKGLSIHSMLWSSEEEGYFWA